jgi:crotonobetainyl-CoA:carnitine CoA-transferase CaiB-like acyl-CoA transferase
MPLQYWENRFLRHAVAWGSPLWFSELRDHQQVRNNDYLLDVDTAWGRVVTGGPPWRFSETPASWTRPPVPGEHTAEIMDEIEDRVASATGDGA